MNTNNDSPDNQNELYFRTSQILTVINTELEGLVKDCRVFRRTLVQTTALSRELFSTSIDIPDVILPQVEHIQIHRDNIWTKESGSLY